MFKQPSSIICLFRRLVSYDHTENMCRIVGTCKEAARRISRDEATYPLILHYVHVLVLLVGTLIHTYICTYVQTYAYI